MTNKSEALRAEFERLSETRDQVSALRVAIYTTLGIRVTIMPTGLDDILHMKVQGEPGGLSALTGTLPELVDLTMTVLA